MILRILNLTLQTHNPIGRTAARCSAWMALAIVSLAAGNAEADLISVTSVSDNVRLQESAFELNLTDTGSNLSGNNLSRIIGTGVNTTGGYRSQQVTTTSGSSLTQGWNVQIPTTASIGPATPEGIGAFGNGSSTIFFNATSDSVYTAAGDNFYGVSNIDTLSQYVLRDLTNSVDLVSLIDGWNGGSAVNTPTGSLTGNLIAGRQYSWTTGFVAQKRAGLSGLNFSAAGNATLNVAAIPEPSAAAILGLAGLGMLMRRRRR